MTTDHLSYPGDQYSPDGVLPSFTDWIAVLSPIYMELGSSHSPYGFCRELCENPMLMYIHMRSAGAVYREYQTQSEMQGDVASVICLCLLSEIHGWLEMP